MLPPGQGGLFPYLPQSGFATKESRDGMVVAAREIELRTTYHRIWIFAEANFGLPA
jgi:hypothetical protein